MGICWMPEGIIYILTNEAMPGYVKVGKTSTSVAQRVRDLDNTSLPYPFECYYAARVADLDLAERLVHDAFDDSRVARRREFFTIHPERIKSAIRIGELEDVTPSEDEIVEDLQDRAALDRARTRQKNKTFSMLGIEPGAQLTFSKAPEITCTVVNDKRVEFDGEVTSVSGSALEVTKRLGYDWPSVNGWAYWQYQGRLLSELWLEAQESD